MLKALLEQNTEQLKRAHSGTTDAPSLIDHLNKVDKTLNTLAYMELREDVAQTLAMSQERDWEEMSLSEREDYRKDADAVLHILA